MRMHAPLTSLVALLTATLLVGCGTEPTQTASDTVPDSSPASVETDGAHDHPSEGPGPHGGELIELGNEEYHGELLHPHAENVGGENVVAIFILDGSAKNVVPIEATEVTLNLVHGGKPAQFQLAASPDDGEQDGTSSRFVSSDEGLIAHFGEEEIDGRLAVTINGKAYSGKLHHHHDGHEHVDGHEHSHSGDDALIWRLDVDHVGYAIRLGHHGEHLHAGEEVEPAIGITRDGKPVHDAKVFNALVAEDEKTVTAKEAPTVYEPPTAEEPAHYAQGALTIPGDAKRIIIRYRIRLPGGTGDVTYNVPVDVE